MNHIEYLINEIEILPATDFILLWERMQEKLKRNFILQFPQIEKRPYALCKGDFLLNSSFYEALPNEIIDLFDGKEN